jgi:peptide/nickel transport system substrate-binding protein
MKRRSAIRVIGSVPLAALATSVLQACGPTPSSLVTPQPTSAPAPTQAPQPSAAPKPTEAAKPTEAPKVIAEPTKPAAAVAPTAAPTAASTPAASAPKKGGTYIDVSFGDAVTMQPLLAQDSASSDRIGIMYAGLLTQDKKLDYQPDLATSYKVSDDKLSISFEMKDNVLWSDGQPITVDDVKFSWDKMLDPKTQYPYQSLYDYFTGLEVTGPRTLTFKLKEVFAPALNYASGVPIIPKHIYEKLDINDNPENTKPTVVSGPYMFKEWVKDDHATFVANEKYYAGRPNLDSVIFRVVKDATVSYAMLKTGEADSSGIQPPDYQEALTNKIFDTYRYYYFAASWDYVAFNLKNPIFADKRVRQALSMALDKQKMIDKIQLGFAKPQYSIYPANSPVFTADVPKFDFDVAKAKSMLDDAGWKAGADGIRVKDGKRLSFRMHFNAGNKRREQIATVAQQYWKDVGVDLSVNQEEWGAFLKRVQETKDFDTIVLGWVGGYEPHGQSNIWSTGQPQNYIGYSNPQIDDLFKKGVTISYDMKERLPIYVQIQKILAEDQAYIVLWTNESIVGVNKRLKGIDPDPLGLTWNLDKWYSETGK